MKIKEIIHELDASKQIGRDIVGGAAKGVGAIAGGVVGAGKAAVKGYQAGAAKMDKLLNPSQWFSGSSTDKPDQDKSPNTLVVRDTLRAASQGLPMQGSDSQNLKQLRQDIYNGKIASTDVENEMAALQAAAQGQKLSPDQLAILKKIHNRY